MTIQSSTSFADLALAPSILTVLKKIGYEQPSPIQAESIPLLLEGKDLLGTAQTGTGKTAAFALPLLSQLETGIEAPQVLVLTPTRELAIQVAEAFQTYAGEIRGFHVLPIYGGQDMRTQLRQLKRGVHVVVGTPGRIMDHLRRGSLKLEQLKSVVLDEADEMLRMGFIEDVTWILEHTPEKKQVALFSATMPRQIRQVADRYLENPAEVKIASKTSTVERIEQRHWLVSGLNKLDALTRMLEVETFDGIIMFTRTKTQTVELADKLEARGYSAAAINSDMSQALRERTIGQLKNGAVDILVATDVAARGIDVERISHVINYDIPYDTEAYVHRIGRTGRAGRSGKAILFVAPRERRLLRAIEKATKQQIKPMDLPTREQVNSKRIEQFKNNLTETLQNQRLEFFENLIQEYLAENETDPVQLSAALAFLAQKDNPIILKENLKKERSTKKEESTRQAPARKKKSDKQESVDMEQFRLTVGRTHKVGAGDIVGAIANEAGVDSAYIGQIDINDDYSTVELPVGMPKEIFLHLKKVRIKNQPLRIERTGAPSAPQSKSQSSKKTKKTTRKKKTRRTK